MDFVEKRCYGREEKDADKIRMASPFIYKGEYHADIENDMTQGPLFA